MGISATAIAVGGGLLLTTAALATGPSWGPDTGHRPITLEGTSARTGAFEREGRITRIYGEAFSRGASPRDSVERFLGANADVLGVERPDLVDHPELGDQLLGYDAATDSFRFTAVNFGQTAAGLPVFRGRLVMLVRNESGYPLVLASSGLRSTQGFQPAVDPAFAPAADEGVQSAQAQIPALHTFTESELVVWAGVDDLVVEPRMAHVFEGVGGTFAGGDYEKWLFVTDAVTGEILYLEDRILHEDVSGGLDGLATEGPGADVCGPEVPMAMPHVTVSAGGSTTFSDANGNYVLSGLPASPVTVTATLRGDWFDVFDSSGTPLDTASITVTPPASGVDLLINPTNPNEFVRAQVNSYLHSNLIRDWVLSYNPSYPTIGNQHNFPVNVNLNSDCNAFYDYASINFYTSGGGCNNTGFSSVVYHEYGHHLVDRAGSGQGAYGEGMGDVMSALMLDEPRLGIGFESCSTGLRTADNTCQYSATACSSCGSAVHSCGNLISGCVWDLREALEVTNPGTGLQIVTQLALDSMLLHTGTAINPDITIDYLVLDDDDETIFNGTPHYAEIAEGFGLHGLDAPPLALVSFAYPDGIPGGAEPGSAIEFHVDVEDITASAVPGTGRITYVLDGGSPVETAMTPIDADTYLATLPAAPCASSYSWFVTVEVADFGDVSDPADGAYTTVVSSGVETLWTDSFQTVTGWSASGTATDGMWEIGIPVDCDRGDPPADADGSGKCMLTDNAAQADCNTDVDGGDAILTSPVLDATGLRTTLSYWRWYSNNFGAEPYSDVMEVEVSDDGGATWQGLETVGPTGAEVEGGWYFKQFDLSAIAGFELNDQFRVRFIVFDSPSGGSVIEAGVDAVSLTTLLCDPALPEDVNGDGVVDVQDLLAVLSAWGACGGCPEDIDGDGSVGVTDLLAVLAAWS